MVEGGGSEPCARFERENEARKEEGDGGDLIPLKLRRWDKGWVGGSGLAGVPRGERRRGVWRLGEMAPAGDQDPAAAAMGGAQHKQGTCTHGGAVRWGAWSWAGLVGEGSGLGPVE
jgi:hypothetical protein